MSYIRTGLGDDPFLVSRSGRYGKGTRIVTVAGNVLTDGTSSAGKRPQAPCNPLVDKTCAPAQPSTNVTPANPSVPSSPTTSTTSPTTSTPSSSSSSTSSPRKPSSGGGGGGGGARPPAVSEPPPRRVVTLIDGNSLPVEISPSASARRTPWLLIAALVGGAYLLTKDESP